MWFLSKKTGTGGIGDGLNGSGFKSSKESHIRTSHSLCFIALKYSCGSEHFILLRWKALWSWNYICWRHKWCIVREIIGPWWSRSFEWTNSGLLARIENSLRLSWLQRRFAVARPHGFEPGGRHEMLYVSLLPLLIKSITFNAVNWYCNPAKLSRNLPEIHWSLDHCEVIRDIQFNGIYWIWKYPCMFMLLYSLPNILAFLYPLRSCGHAARRDA